MDSLTEEELLQMVRDFIESESESATSVWAPSSKALSHHDQPPYDRTLNDILQRITKAEVEVLEKVLMHLREMGIAMEPKHPKEDLAIRLKTDGYEASLCRTSTVWAISLSEDEYEFIDITVRGGNGDQNPTRLIVDVDFRSQFELIRPTPTYKELINKIPSVFVGTEEKLQGIISLICKAAERSLRERDLHIPPWRKASYMQSKWLSQEYKKIAAPAYMDYGMVSKE